MMENRAIEPSAESGSAYAEEGVVIIDGPGGLAATLTADAAARMGQNLIEAARQAFGQLAGRSNEPKT